MPYLLRKLKEEFDRWDLKIKFVKLNLCTGKVATDINMDGQCGHVKAATNSDTWAVLSILRINVKEITVEFIGGKGP